MQDDLTRESKQIATICNSCRYCEGFCAVFPAIELRRSFTRSEMSYLANLCHNCGECLQACPYSPPHPFEVNVPLVMAKTRLRSYEEYCCPQVLGVAFRSYSVRAVLAILALVTAVLLTITGILERHSLVGLRRQTSFYTVIPHDLMVCAFGTVFLLAVAAMAIAVARFVKDVTPRHAPGRWRNVAAGVRDALTLKYLHGSGRDCDARTSAYGLRRRVFHHLTFYGFGLCFASTSVAAIYQGIWHLQAPYPIFSLPVVLGMLGGIGLIVGPSGLWMTHKRRLQETVNPKQEGLDRSFLLLLIFTSVTGLALLALRGSRAMAIVLIVHLSVVLTLIVSLPYGKFMHGLYRAAALIQYARESRSSSPR